MMETHEDTLVYKNSASFKIEMELIQDSLKKLQN